MSKSVYEGKSAKELKPKREVPSPKMPIRGMSDKIKLQLMEFDGVNAKKVKDDVARKPGYTYFYEGVK